MGFHAWTAIVQYEGIVLARPLRGALRINPSGDLNQPPSTMCFVMQRQVSLSPSLYRENEIPDYARGIPEGIYAGYRAAGSSRSRRPSDPDLSLFSSERVDPKHSLPTDPWLRDVRALWGGPQPCVASHTQYTHTNHALCFCFGEGTTSQSGRDAVMLDLIDGRAPVVAWCGVVCRYVIFHVCERAMGH